MLFARCHSSAQADIGVNKKPIGLLESYSRVCCGAVVNMAYLRVTSRRSLFEIVVFLDFVFPEKHLHALHVRQTLSTATKIRVRHQVYLNLNNSPG